MLLLFYILQKTGLYEGVLLLHRISGLILTKFRSGYFHITDARKFIRTKFRWPL